MSNASLIGFALMQAMSVKVAIVVAVAVKVNI